MPGSCRLCTCWAVSSRRFWMTPAVDRSGDGEAAAALAVVDRCCRERIDVAGILVEDLPGVFEALERGLIDAGRARGDHGGHL